MNQLLELLLRYCQLTNIQPALDSKGNLELYPIFLAAHKKGLLNSEHLDIINQILGEGF
jgi:hypothetical protein